MSGVNSGMTTFKVRLTRDRYCGQKLLQKGEVIEVYPHIQGSVRIPDTPCMLLYPCDYIPYLDEMDFEKLLKGG